MPLSRATSHWNPTADPPFVLQRNLDLIGKIIGAFVGDKLAKQISGMGGATGAALGVAATSLIARLSLPSMLAILAGGYAAKRYLERNVAAHNRAEML